MSHTGIDLANFDYNLPPELIASKASTKRDQSRLLVFDLKTGKLTDDYFFNLEKYLPANSTLVVNESKVIPARIKFSQNDKLLEILIAEQISETTIKALVYPGKKFQPGQIIPVNEKLNLLAEVTKINDDGSRTITFNQKLTPELLEQIGKLPLPPYVKDTEDPDLLERYQTVYAQKTGSIAAPTAGLHFTEELLNNIKKNHNLAKITLHVGLGTFKPIKTNNILEHKMHAENYEINEENTNIINQTLEQKKPIIAVGTTTLRTLETQIRAHGKIIAGEDQTDIFIYPGQKIASINGLITNFHLPKSSLFVLISALIGLDNAQAIYQHAIKKKYRFYSFGDACLFLL
jgi:S-adenosylmethionine:tRNA ribosyltransferase-isomerase